MSVIPLLASSLGEKSEEPNIQLAQSIAARKDLAAVTELFSLFHGKKKDLQSDAIKTIYELGALEPKMIHAYLNDLVALLSSKENRIIWGAMTALHEIANIDKKSIHAQLGEIMKACDSGSVITRDHAVGILAKLAGEKLYHEECMALLFEQLLASPVNQLGMYAEKILPVVKFPDKPKFTEILNGRLPELEKESQKKRILKVISRL